MNYLRLFAFVFVACVGCVGNTKTSSQVLVYDMATLKMRPDGSRVLSKSVCVLSSTKIQNKFDKTVGRVCPNKANDHPSPSPNANWLIVLGKNSKTNQDVAFWLFAAGGALWRYDQIGKSQGDYVLPPRPSCEGHSEDLAKAVAEELRQINPLYAKSYDIMHDPDPFREFAR